MRLSEFLKDSNYKLSQFEGDMISEIEDSIFLIKSKITFIGWRKPYFIDYYGKNCQFTNQKH